MGKMRSESDAACTVDMRLNRLCCCLWDTCCSGAASGTCMACIRIDCISSMPPASQNKLTNMFVAWSETVPTI